MGESFFSCEITNPVQPRIVDGGEEEEVQHVCRQSGSLLQSVISNLMPYTPRSPLIFLRFESHAV